MWFIKSSSPRDVHFAVCRQLGAFASRPGIITVVQQQAAHCTTDPQLAGREITSTKTSAAMADGGGSPPCVLYKGPPAWGLPSISPACMQAEVRRCIGI